MVNSNSWVAVAFLALCSGLPQLVHANDKTPGDKIAEAEVTLELLQKQRQINDMLGSDPILRALPSVVSVFVLQDKKSARLALANGVVQTFNEGDVITERMKLLSVSARRVRVQIEPLPNAKSKKSVPMALTFKPANTALATPSGAGMATGYAAGIPAAPLAIPAGLMQSVPMLGTSSGLWSGMDPSTASAQQPQPATPAQ